VDPAALLHRAARIADDVLFPAALAVDRADRVPAGHLDLLAEKGFYGLAGPPEYGGVTNALAHRVTETLASGCLATAFVWVQHHGAVRAAAGAPPPIRDAWLEPLCRGRRRAGVVLAALRPGPASVRATAVPGGYRLDGAAPWVTGWDLVDTLLTAARLDDATVVWALLDAVASPSLRFTLLDPVAVAASRTGNLHFDGHFVPDERVAGTMPYADWPARDAAGLRGNGSLALGVVARCCRLMGPGPFDAELSRCRDALDAAGPEALPAARAAASELAVRAAAALTVHTGSRAILRDDHAQRLVREAAFLLVFGTRPGIRDALRARLHPR
jgi:alkylation response protein AidB-like acyl-CoA dehydrogenase